MSRDTYQSFKAQAVEIVAQIAELTIEKAKIDLDKQKLLVANVFEGLDQEAKDATIIRSDRNKKALENLEKLRNAYEQGKVANEAAAKKVSMFGRVLQKLSRSMHSNVWFQ